MAIEKPKRRMTLQELLAHLEKYPHDFSEYLRQNFQPSLGDMREMSRPKRKHSQYPTLVAFKNALDNMRKTSDELDRMTAAMKEWFAQVDDHARREQSRM